MIKTLKRVSVAIAVALILTPAAAQAQSRFAVVDLDPSPDHDALVTEVEREYARLRPGSQPIDDPVARRLLAQGEGPADAAHRVLRESHRARAADDCATAVKLGRQAETMLLSALSLDEERDPLKGLYSSLILCELKLGNAAGVAAAAARLRGLVSLPPSDLTQDVWDKHVANASLGEPTTELQIDSDPANGQVAVNLHGDGVTPRTLKVPKGIAFVEVQKEGYKKAFRAVEIKDRPVRTVLRLVQRAHDRIEQAELQLKGLRMSEAELTERTGSLSRLSQLARVETLVLLQVNGDRVRISFFDAEKGAVTGTPIESGFDAASGRVEALAKRTTPSSSGPGLEPGAAPPPPTPARAAAVATAPTTPASDRPAAPASATAPAPAPAAADPSGLPEARAAKQQADFIPRRRRPGAPWWSWVIAGTVGAAFLTFMYADRLVTSETVGVRASWPGGQSRRAVSPGRVRNDFRWVATSAGASSWGQWPASASCTTWAWGSAVRQRSRRAGGRRRSFIPQTISAGTEASRARRCQSPS